MKKPFRIKKIADKTWSIEIKTAYFQGLVYLLEGGEKALLIDSAVNIPGLRELVSGLSKKPIELAITHGHLDHIGSAHQFGRAYVSEADSEVLQRHTDPAFVKAMIADEFPPIMQKIFAKIIKEMTAPLPPTEWLPLPESFELGGRKIEVIKTPGHTPGSVCFLDRGNRLLFSGDTVCDWGVLLHFPEGRPPAVFLDSLRKLKALESEYDFIYPGHHGAPSGQGVADRYIACAEGIINGGIKPKSDKSKLVARYKDIRITLPKRWTANDR
ncbi:MAG: MBL fold metallo-hydrolase [Oscillospiraceae bacterium]|jgi:glyoxylase-like metal-dependent hydrolase (beta-lactamase superfamily II)|nr:MBL fold metallo-hydrolase [Oscillospiraceae bacterium]